MSGFEIAFPDELFEAIAERAAEIVLERLGELRDGPAWFDVEGAAEYLAMPAERLRKLIGRRAIPFHQEAPGHRIFLHRPELDSWMASSRHAPRGAA